MKLKFKLFLATLIQVLIVFVISNSKASALSIDDLFIPTSGKHSGSVLNIIKPKVQEEPIQLKEIEPVKPISSWHYRDQLKPREAEVKQAVEELGLGSNWIYISYIFNKESTFDPGILNELDCTGLGQACPGTKLPCGPDEIHCQIKWFDWYAKESYGSWYQAYIFRTNHIYW